MPEQKITANFSYYEFRPEGAPTTWYPEFDVQAYMLKVLAENLQIVRSAVPASSFKITSGVRTIQDYARLKSLGYNPSETSDHYCGFSVPLSESSPKRSNFGSNYSYAVGAADIVPSGMVPLDLFKRAVEMTKAHQCDFGQIIHEFDPVKKTEWVHFGNNPYRFVGPAIVRFISRGQFLQTKDGGKTYTSYSG